MNWNLLIIRVVFFVLATLSGYLICLFTPEWHISTAHGVYIAGSIACLVIVVDIFLRGFSLRGFTSLTLGIFIGWLAAKIISISPILELGDKMGNPEIIYVIRLALFAIFMYLGAVVALRGKDDFNFIIPFVRFVPQEANNSLVVVDTSALIDGRIVGICGAKFLSNILVIPQFVLDELHQIADSDDANRRTRGRKGLESLAELKKMSHMEIRVHESNIKHGQSVDDKLIFLSGSLRARLLTTDMNLAKLAEFHSVECLNLNALVRSLRSETVVGEILSVQLVKQGKEPGQTVGYLGDGSMVVVENSRDKMGKTVEVEVLSILPSAGGRMIFGKIKA